MNGKYWLLVITSPILILVNYVIVSAIVDPQILIPDYFFYIHLLIFNGLGGGGILFGFYMYSKINPETPLQSVGDGIRQ
jgi:hypothetical protein